MSRSVLLLMTLLCVASPAAALDFEGAGVKGGLAFLLTNFEFEGEDRLDNDTATGPLLGAFVELEWSRRSAFHLVLEATWVRKGYEGVRELASDPGPVDVDVSANYLSLPILGRVLFNDDEDFLVYAHVGPSLEILLDHDDDALLDDFEKWTLAGNVGIGVEFLLTDPLRALLDFRFNTDFTDSYGGGDVEQVSDVRQQSVSVAAGLRF